MQYCANSLYDIESINAFDKDKTMAEYFIDFKHHPDNGAIEWRWAFTIDADELYNA